MKVKYQIAAEVYIKFWRCRYEHITLERAASFTRSDMYNDGKRSLTTIYDNP